MHMDLGGSFSHKQHNSVDNRHLEVVVALRQICE